MTGPLRIATRTSAQASAQARAVGEALLAADPSRPVELVPVDTTGDRRRDVPLHEIGGQGVFVKEVQRAVLDGHADIAVHSAKDLPSAPAAGLVIGAFCARRDPRDVLVGLPLADLVTGATVATGSVRRRAQLRAVRPDLHFEELRGNITTRLSKVPEGGSIVMAMAALEILGLTDRVAQALEVEAFVPAVGQGCVAVECRAGDDVEALVAAVDDATTRAAVEVERAFLATLGSGCSLPVGAHVAGGTLTAFLADPTTDRHLTREVTVPDDLASALERAADLARSMHDELGGAPLERPGGMSPLAGRKVVVTRTTEQAGSLVDLLRERGAQPIEVPLIRIEDDRAGMAALGGLVLRDFEWVVVTSPNGASRLRAFHALELAERRGLNPSIAAVGSVTAARLGECHLVPPRQSAEGLLEVFPAPSRPGARVLVVQALGADPLLVEGLRAKGWWVDAVAPFHTAAVEPTARQRLEALSADAVLFASGSAVRAWVLAFGPVAPVHAVAIGPATAAAAAAAGLKISVVATDHSVLGLVASLETSLISSH